MKYDKAKIKGDHSIFMRRIWLFCALCVGMASGASAFRQSATPSDSHAISGHVVAAGQPVQGAHVELALRHPNYLGNALPGHWNGLYYGFKNAAATTGGDGYFCIATDFHDTEFYVRAWMEGFAEGIAGPVRVGADTLVQLDRGGEVTGVLRLPNGLPAEGVKLIFLQEELDDDSIYSSLGRIFSAETNANGEFVQRHLTSGVWLVKTIVPEALGDDLAWSKMDYRTEAYPRVVQVTQGKATGLSYALGDREMCVLHGKVSMGSLIREGQTELLLEGHQALSIDNSRLDKNGRFVLVVREPGTYRLVINAGPAHDKYKVITDLVQLGPGTSNWERDLPVSCWEGDGVRLDSH